MKRWRWVTSASILKSQILTMITRIMYKLTKAVLRYKKDSQDHFKKLIGVWLCKLRLIAKRLYFLSTSRLRMVNSSRTTISQLINRKFPQLICRVQIVFSLKLPTVVKELMRANTKNEPSTRWVCAEDATTRAVVRKKRRTANTKHVLCTRAKCARHVTWNYIVRKNNTLNDKLKLESIKFPN